MKNFLDSFPPKNKSSSPRIASFTKKTTNNHTYSIAMTAPTTPAAAATAPAPWGAPPAAALSVGVGPAWKPPLPSVLVGMLSELSAMLTRVLVDSASVAVLAAEVGVWVFVP